MRGYGNPDGKSPIAREGLSDIIGVARVSWYPQNSLPEADKNKLRSRVPTPVDTVFKNARRRPAEYSAALGTRE
jgi:hypothetical protein